MADLTALSNLLGNIGKSSYSAPDYAGAAQNYNLYNQAQQLPALQRTLATEFGSGTPNKSNILSAIGKYDPMKAAELSGMFASSNASANQALIEARRQAAGEAVVKIEEASALLTKAKSEGKEPDPEVLSKWMQGHKEYTAATGTRYTGGYQTKLTGNYMEQQKQEADAVALASDIADKEAMIVDYMTKNGTVPPAIMTEYQTQLAQYQANMGKPWVSDLSKRINDVMDLNKYDIDLVDKAKAITDAAASRYQKIADRMSSIVNAAYAMEAVIKDAQDGKPAAQNLLAKSVSQIIEPGLAVLQGEVNALSGGSEMLSKLTDIYNMVNALTNKAGGKEALEQKASVGAMQRADVTALYRVGRDIVSKLGDGYGEVVGPINKKANDDISALYSSAKREIPKEYLKFDVRNIVGARKAPPPTGNTTTSPAAPPTGAPPATGGSAAVPGTDKDL